MAYYGNDEPWSAPARQPSWEQQMTPSRSSAGSAMSQHTDSNAFASQFEEIERATDNLMKSGKWAPGPAQGAGMPGRRESGPGGSRGYEFGGDPRMGGGPPRHQSGGEYDGGRPGSAGLQGFYQGQRFPPRQSEAEQMLQAKRRMAAQRERELRNYHQEQQYHRSVKTDRAMSPTTMSEEDRRELIARQHRALYGDNSSLYTQDGTPRPQSQDVRASSSGRGQSPLAFDPYGQAQAGAEGAVQMPPRERTTSTASPVANAPAQQSFSHLNEQNSRTSTSSPGASPPLGPGQKGSTSGVAPIGTRPAQGVGAANKRATTPLTPSSLSYGFSNNDAQNALPKEDRTTSSAAPSASLTADKNVSGLGGWGGNSAGVWGSGKGSLGVQASVWG